MADTDRITESGKRAIVEVLNRIVQAEYSFIINYPRIIDQLVTVEKVADEQLVADLERLARESSEHLGIITQLTTRLGGETAWRITTIDRMVDLDSLGEQQLAGERDAIRLYTDAKRLAEDNPVRSGFREKLRSSSGAEPDAAPRGETIRLLEHLSGQERTHERTMEDCLATYRAIRGPSN
jgi:hypothetical protein